MDIDFIWLLVQCAVIGMFVKYTCCGSLRLGSGLRSLFTLSLIEFLVFCGVLCWGYVPCRHESRGKGSWFYSSTIHVHCLLHLSVDTCHFFKALQTCHLFVVYWFRTRLLFLTDVGRVAAATYGSSSALCTGSWWWSLCWPSASQRSWTTPSNCSASRYDDTCQIEG